MLFLALSVVAPAVNAQPAHGGFIEFTNRDAWFAQVGPLTTIDFTGFPPGAFLTNQYADLGIVFTDGNDSIYPDDIVFPNDGVGLDGNGDINISFKVPQLWLAADYPGFLRIQLFFDGALIFDGPNHLPGGAGNFLGVIASRPFDAARLIDPAGEAAIDDLYFGVPSPPTLLLIAALLFITHRTRKPPSATPRLARVA